MIRVADLKAKDVGNWSDWEIMQFAAENALNRDDIKRVERDLRELRAFANKTDAEVKKVKKVVGPGSPYRLKANAGGLSAGPVKFSRGRFTLSPKAVKGAGTAYIVFGAANQVGAVAREWRENEQVKKRYGVQEQLGRSARKTLETAFAPADPLAETVGEFVHLAGGDRLAYLRRAKDLKRFFFETPAEEIERKVREHAAMKEAQRKTDEWLNEQLQFVKTYQPPNVQVKTSGEVAALRKMMFDRNTEFLQKGAKEVAKINFKGLD